MHTLKFTKTRLLLTQPQSWQSVKQSVKQLFDMSNNRTNGGNVANVPATNVATNVAAPAPAPDKNALILKFLGDNNLTSQVMPVFAQDADNDSVVADDDIGMCDRLRMKWTDQKKKECEDAYMAMFSSTMSETTKTKMRDISKGRRLRAKFLLHFHSQVSLEHRKVAQFVIGAPVTTVLNHWNHNFLDIGEFAYARYAVRQFLKLECPWNPEETLQYSCDLALRWCREICNVNMNKGKLSTVVNFNKTNSHLKRHIRTSMALLVTVAIRNCIFGPYDGREQYEKCLRDMCHDKDEEYLHCLVKPLVVFLYKNLNHPQCQQRPLGNEGRQSISYILNRGLKNSIDGLEKRAENGVWSENYIFGLIQKKQFNKITQNRVKGVHFHMLRLAIKLIPDFEYNADKLYITDEEKAQLFDPDDAVDDAGMVTGFFGPEDDDDVDSD